MRQLITHFTDNDLYTFTCQYYVLRQYPRAEVEYSFIDRNNTVYPKGFADMLQEQVNYMAGVVITDEEVDYMKKRNLIIRIIAIAMCALMVLGIITVAIYAFAETPGEPLPSTGSNDTALIFAIAAAVAIVAAIICIVLSKKKK